MANHLLDHSSLSAVGLCQTGRLINYFDATSKQVARYNTCCVVLTTSAQATGPKRLLCTGRPPGQFVIMMSDIATVMHWYELERCVLVALRCCNLLLRSSFVSRDGPNTLCRLSGVCCLEYAVDDTSYPRTKCGLVHSARDQGKLCFLLLNRHNASWRHT